jgi:predicted DNA-binding WGR domain protein
VLQHTEDGHFKFYRVEVEETVTTGQINYMVTCTWGKIGTAGSASNTIYLNQKDALKFADGKIGEKLGKGYKELTDQAVYPDTVEQVIVPKEFTETPESLEKFDLFLNTLKF